MPWSENPIGWPTKIAMYGFKDDIGVEQQTELDGLLDVALFTQQNGRLVYMDQIWK